MFFWGIKKEFAALGLHNILFSDDYKRNLIICFQNNSNRRPYCLYQYYFKILKMMPEGCENWFVMVNVPHNKSESINYAAAIKNVVDKINMMLKTDIEKYY
jgi:hypothetical protein